MDKIFKVGLIGCGHIAETYFRAHKYFNNFKIIKCADINSKVSDNCAKKYKIQSKSVAGILKDKQILIAKIRSNCCARLLNKPYVNDRFNRAKPIFKVLPAP